MFESSPESEGIKTRIYDLTGGVIRLKVALNRKGLRPILYAGISSGTKFESSPESEGIKTSQVAAPSASGLFESSPESEGIKTQLVCWV